MARLLLGGLLLLGVAHPAVAKVASFRLFEMADTADIVVVGRVLEVGDESARLQVSEVLKGSTAAKTILVSPIHIQHCLGRDVHFKVGEEAAVLLRRSADGSLLVVGDGQGKIGLKPESRETELQALRRLIEIASLKETAARSMAMLAEATSANQRLRRESHVYIAVNLARGKLDDDCTRTLIGLLAHEDDDVRTAALSGLQFARSDEALPLIIEATRDDSPRVVSQASMALGRYDTLESVAALIALTRSPDADIRTRAAIDLDDSRRPEAKQALKRLLDDPDPTVRAHAPRRFFGLLRRGQADDVVPTLISMLDDPVDEVRAAAAHALGESRNSAAVEPLVGVLQREAIGPGTEDWTLKALALLYTRAGPEARRVIEFNLDLIIASLKRGQWHASWGAAEILGSAKTPQAIAALEWAAEEHPLPGVRDLAAHLLGRVRVP